MKLLLLVINPGPAQNRGALKQKASALTVRQNQRTDFRSTTASLSSGVNTIHDSSLL